LTSLEIPASVQEVGVGAFPRRYYRTLSVHEGNPTLCVENDILWKQAAQTSALLYVGCGGELEISAEAERIETEAFSRCEASLKVCFESGSKLLEIADRAFFMASGLTEIVIPSGVVLLGVACFAECVSLHSITFESESHLSEIREDAFRNCESLTSIAIPASVGVLAANCFADCERLTTVVWESRSKQRQIGEAAFSGCPFVHEIG
jgi:hypothetical protein